MSNDDLEAEDRELLYQGMGLKDYKRAGSFACARVDGITAKTFNYDPEEWDAAISKINQWASTKAGGSKPQSGNGQLYQPMRDPYEIRVLHLSPGTGSDKLRGTLHHCSVELKRDDNRSRWAVSMDDFTTMVCYTALSYCWGPPVFEASIECDGHEKKITKSLETALRQLRQPDWPIVMWIDQICVNQDDDREKEQQIPLMGRIYTQAKDTVIWLGEGTAGSDAAMQLLDRINPCLQFRLTEMKPGELERIGLPPPDSLLWEELWKFLSRPWFTRVWIIQETILPAWGSLWVACGGNLVPWDIIDDCCNDLVTCGISRWLEASFGAIGTRDEDACQRALSLGEMRSDHLTSLNGSEIFSLLLKARNAQCYDPRDKVYGLLGVCSDEDRNAVTVSYAKECTAADLYRDVTSRYIGEKALRVGIAVCYADHESPDLPSWVPDWRLPSRVIPLGSSWAQGVYTAYGRLKGKVLHGVESRERGELCVQGLLVDSIAKVGEPAADPELTFTDPAANKTLLDCVKFVSQLQRDPPNDTIFNAFWRTLVAGKNGDGTLKCPPTFAEIFSLILDETTGGSPSLPGQTYSARQKRPKGKGRLELSNLTSRAPGETFQQIRTAMKRALQNRRLGATSRGYLGLFPERAREGDVMYVLENCTVPFVMRSAERHGGKLRLVGECYVDGIMEGEAVEAEDVSLEKIVLV
ncbi:hypothetical protein ACJ41O_001441 [Fusarium nematophilum]